MLLDAWKALREVVVAVVAAVAVVVVVVVQQSAKVRMSSSLALMVAKVAVVQV